MQLQRNVLTTMSTAQLAAAFPSLESLTIEHCDFHSSPRHDSFDAVHGHTMFRVLGGLKNLNKLEFDTYGRDHFTTPTTTASGPSKLLTLSALSKVETLLLRADMLVYTSRDKKTPIQRAATILPLSLRSLTLLLDNSCGEWLAYGAGMRKSAGKCDHMVIAFLQEVAPALLTEHPHLEKVNLCYNMEDYRQHKVHLLAARYTAGGGAAS